MKSHDPDPPSFWPSSILWHGQGVPLYGDPRVFEIVLFQGLWWGVPFCKCGFCMILHWFGAILFIKICNPFRQISGAPTNHCFVLLNRGLFGDEINIIQWHPHSSCPWEFSRGVPSISQLQAGNLWKQNASEASRRRFNVLILKSKLPIGYCVAPFYRGPTFASHLCNASL